MTLARELSRMPWTVRYFVTRDGRVPQIEFEDALPSQVLATLQGKIFATASVDGRIGGHIFCALHTVSGLFEVRAKQGSDLVRSFCCRTGSNLILLNGVRKREGDQTPPAVIAEASRLRNEYLETNHTEPPF